MKLPPTHPRPQIFVRVDVRVGVVAKKTYMGGEMRSETKPKTLHFVRRTEFECRTLPGIGQEEEARENLN